MKKHLLLLLTVTQFYSAFCQHIKYQKNFVQTLTLAANSGKPVFVRFTTKNTVLPDSTHLQDGFESKDVASFYNKNFVSYSVDLDDTVGAKINRMFHPDKFPAYIFLDNNGEIVYKDGGNYRSPEKYLGFAKTALQRIKSGNTLADFERKFKQGKLTTTAQLKAFINLRTELSLPDDQDLLDSLVATFTIKDLDNYSKVWYVFQHGPIAYSKTYNLIYTNPKLVDSIFKTEPLAARVAVNTSIITNSRNLAIKNKDQNLAQRSANFAASTWGKDYKKSYKTSTSEMLIYYKAIKDTTSYFSMAEYFYDQNYLNISTDSARKLQNNSAQSITQSLQSLAPKKGIAGTVVVRKMERLSPYSTVASTLNNAAWDFYIMGTHNTNHLIKALLWSKRAIDLYPLYTYYDTMAHIMYRLNFTDEALLNQQKAIDIATSIDTSPQTEIDYLKEELGKMKNRKL